MATLKYRIIYTVKGEGGFPLDMLRYDGSFPVDQESVVKIHESMNPDNWYKEGEKSPIYREVKLCKFAETKNWSEQPTKERWRSFGWACLVEKIEKI